MLKIINVFEINWKNVKKKWFKMQSDIRISKKKKK